MDKIWKPYIDQQVFCSFSGGRTSAAMSKVIKESPLKDVQYVFSNTGQEAEETLEFVHECDQQFKLNLTWIEAEVHHNKRVASTHRVVDYKTATRDGSLFEAMIQKYGIPNQSYPHCTRELKTNPMHSYIRSLGWTNYYTAIGIRADEIDRISVNYEKNKWWYPLANMRVTKKDIEHFWNNQTFKLDLPELRGNCTWCWKKSFSKHMKLIAESPEIYDVPRALEAKYSQPKGNQFKTGQDRVFFRESKSTQDLFQMHKDKVEFEQEEFFGCEESCEAFGTEK